MTEASRLAEQYATSDPLAVRVETHRLYTRGPELEPAVDAVLGLRGMERVLDVGTGPGTFPVRLVAAGHAGEVVGLDLHSGMFAEMQARGTSVRFVQGGCEELPFPDASFEVVTARHMLYHVADIPRALAESRRVLRPGGRFLAVTNGRDNMAPFWDVVARAAETYEPLDDFKSIRGVLSFSDHNAEELLRGTFGNVEIRRLDARLEFPSPGPVERYFHSCLPGRTGVEVGPAMEAFRRALLSVFPAEGPWIVPKTIILAVSSSV